MIEDLQNASKLLSAALDQYFTACSAIVTAYDPSHTLKSISQEIADTVQNEIEVIASYHTKLTNAQTMVNRTRNKIPTIAPIHMLSSDILSYIFQLVRDTQPDYLDKDLNTYPQTYPETLTHVCSHWRQIAIDSRALWSHIQISDSSCTSTYHARLLERARAFTARADPSPLDIHIVRGSDNCYDNSLNDFCASIATRIRTFDMSAKRFGESRIANVQRWLANCRPGSLNELVLKHATSDTSFVRIEASEDPIGSNSLLLEMPHDYLEERLRPVKILRLTGIYFQWTSQAYHGLVELRLLPIRDGENLAITQSRLKEILTASPRLREIHLGLQITDVLSPSDLGPAVSLDDLEVVNMCSMRGGHYGPLLQLLAPGRKPLRLSMNSRLTSSLSLLGSEAMEFIDRSNVTKLHIESYDPEETGRYQPVALVELLKHVPNLRALSLRCFYLGSSLPGSQPQGGDLSSYADGTELRSHLPPQLDIVHLRKCTIDFDYLRRVIQIVPVQELKYKGCWFHSMADGYSSQFEDPQPRDNVPPTFSYVSPSWSLDESDPWA